MITNNLRKVFSSVNFERKVNPSDWIIQNIKKNCPEKIILDLGCGDLQYSKIALDARAKKIIAIDLKQPMEIVEGIFFLKGDAQKLILEDKSVEVVLSIGLLEYVDLEKTISEMKRVLKDKGIIILQTKDSRSWRDMVYRRYCEAKNKKIYGKTPKIKNLILNLRRNFKILEIKETKPKHNIMILLQND